MRGRQLCCPVVSHIALTCCCMLLLSNCSTWEPSCLLLSYTGAATSLAFLRRLLVQRTGSMSSDSSRARLLLPTATLAPLAQAVAAAARSLQRSSAQQHAAAGVVEGTAAAGLQPQQQGQAAMAAVAASCRPANDSTHTQAAQSDTAEHLRERVAALGEASPRVAVESRPARCASTSLLSSSTCRGPARGPAQQQVQMRGGTPAATKVVGALARAAVVAAALA